jgi:BirA family transcriptional regulator, biotin operon repressor / biotin---[acetyl-CoA-carboxylase] ligase
VPAGTALTFSLLVRPDIPLHQLGSISIATAHTLCNVFAALGANNVALKWPNDVLLNGRKVSGILVQTRLIPDPVAVIGIGVNVTTPIEMLPPAATSLRHHLGQAINRDELFDQVVTAIDSLWTNWQSDLCREEIDDIDRTLWFRGEEVALLDGDREITGIVLGVASNGGLRMLIDEEERTILAGEISRGPRPTGTGTRS